jgi:1-hydroxycarotenoid 3,4-desaturase
MSIKIDISELRWRGPLGIERVVIIGAGVGGLAAAIDLAGRGIKVAIYEAAARPGGKMRPSAVDGGFLDAGPTVFTMRDVFEELFADAGAALQNYITLRPLSILARHAWDENERLDLFSDIEQSADAIGEFAGVTEAAGFRQFCRRSQQIFEALEHAFMRTQRPSPFRLVAGAGLSKLGGLLRISPFSALWPTLGSYFRDRRIRQLFARYATYCGSSPFDAPATLMLVAHAERKGVWIVEGGMHRLSDALARLAEQRGAVIHYGCRVAEIVTSGSQVRGIRLLPKDFIPADAIVCNADIAALTRGLFGESVQCAAAKTLSHERSLSALTWLIRAESNGFPLVRHCVFFSADYPAEFGDIFGIGHLPSDPTVYVCAQDRDDLGSNVPHGRERLLCLVNAPPIGDSHHFTDVEVEQCRNRTFHRLEKCGLRINSATASMRTVTPTDFNRLYPGTGGALYGRASHGWRASFQRPGSRSRIPGLYLAGGSVHPGPGIPMAALSGRLAAEAVLADLASIKRYRPTGTHGGMSMRSAMTANTD